MLDFFRRKKPKIINGYEIDYSKAVETCPECQSDVYEIIGMPSNYLYCPKCEKVILAVFAVDPDLIEEYHNKI